MLTSIIRDTPTRNIQFHYTVTFHNILHIQLFSHQILRCTFKSVVHLFTHFPANANTGKKAPRQCRRWLSSSVIGLYQSSKRRDSSLVDMRRPPNINLASPSVERLRTSLVCSHNILARTIMQVIFQLCGVLYV